MRKVLGRLGIAGQPYSLSLGVFAALLATMWWINVEFYDYYNLSTKLSSLLPLIFVALGQTAVILGGGIDLSVSSMLAMVNVAVTAAATRLGEDAAAPHWIAALALLAVAVGGAAGLVNGLLVSVCRLPALIATFATQIIWSGVALQIMADPGGDIPFEWYEYYAMDVPLWFGENAPTVPMPVLILLATGIALLLLRRTGFLVHLRAVGGNPSGALESALPMVRIRIKSYVICGALTGLAALFIISQTVSGNPLSGSGYELRSISAAALGGTSLAGGYGAFLGSVVGVGILKLVDDLIFFFDLPVNFQVLMQGLIIVLALAAGDVMRRIKNIGGKDEA